MQKSRIDILNGGSGKQIGADKSEQKIIGRSHAKGGVDVKHASGEDYELEGGEVVDGDRVFSAKLKSSSGETFAVIAESLLKAKKKANDAFKVASSENKIKIRKKIKALEEELTKLFDEQQEQNNNSTGEYAAIGTEMGLEVETPEAQALSGETASVEPVAMDVQEVSEPASIPSDLKEPVSVAGTGNALSSGSGDPIADLYEILKKSNKKNYFNNLEDFRSAFNSDKNGVINGILLQSDLKDQFNVVLKDNFSEKPGQKDLGTQLFEQSTGGKTIGEVVKTTPVKKVKPLTPEEKIREQMGMFSGGETSTGVVKNIEKNIEQNNRAKESEATIEDISKVIGDDYENILSYAKGDGGKLSTDVIRKLSEKGINIDDATTLIKEAAIKARMNKNEEFADVLYSQIEPNEIEIGRSYDRNNGAGYSYLKTGVENTEEFADFVDKTIEENIKSGKFPAMGDDQKNELRTLIINTYKQKGNLKTAKSRAAQTISDQYVEIGGRVIRKGDIEAEVGTPGLNYDATSIEEILKPVKEKNPSAYEQGLKAWKEGKQISYDADYNLKISNPLKVEEGKAPDFQKQYKEATDEIYNFYKTDVKAKINNLPVTEEYKKASDDLNNRFKAEYDAMYAQLNQAVQSGSLPGDAANAQLQAFANLYDSRSQELYNSYSTQINENSQRVLAASKEELKKKLDSASQKVKADIERYSGLIGREFKGLEDIDKVTAEVRSKAEYYSRNAFENIGIELTRGVYQIMDGISGMSSYLGANEFANFLNDASRQYNAEYLPFNVGEFSFSQLINPDFWITKFTPMIPFVTSLMIPGYGAGRMAMAAVTKLGLTGLTRAAAGGAASALAMRPIESFLEAGFVYKESIDRGLSSEEAAQNAVNVMGGNLKLILSDFLQSTMLFSPAALNRGFSSALGKAGTMIVTEGGEEVYQEYLQKKQFTPGITFFDYATTNEGLEVFTLGAAGGLMFGSLSIMKDILNRPSNYEKFIRNNLLKMIEANSYPELSASDRISRRTTDLIAQVQVLGARKQITDVEAAKLIKDLEFMGNTLKSLPTNISRNEKVAIVEGLVSVKSIEDHIASNPDMDSTIKEGWEKKLKQAKQYVQDMMDSKAQVYMVGPVVMNKEQFLSELDKQDVLKGMSDGSLDTFVQNDPEVSKIMEDKINQYKAKPKTEADKTTSVSMQEAIANRSRTDLFPDQTEFADVIGGSGSNSTISSYREVNGIGISEYTNPENGLVDVIMTGTSDNDYVGYVRIYENGKATNRWTSKMENKSGNKENFKTMISEVKKLLPEGHEYTEKTNISLDGLRVYSNNLSRGYDVATDENGNQITNRVELNNATVESLRSAKTEEEISSLYEGKRGVTEEEFAKIKEKINSMMPGVNVVYNKNNGSVSIDLPVLVSKEKKSAEGKKAEPKAPKSKKPKVDSLPVTGEVDRTNSVAVDEAPGGTFINVGLNIGKTDEQITEEDVVSRLPEDVEVLEMSRIEPESGTVQEPTLSIKLSRPLTDAEMAFFLEDTQQEAVPQVSENSGAMYGSTDYGDFNGYYFVMPDGKRLSNVAPVSEVKAPEEKAAESKETPARYKPKQSEYNVNNVSELEAEAASAKDSITKKILASAAAAIKTVANVRVKGKKGLTFVILSTNKEYDDMLDEKLTPDQAKEGRGSYGFYLDEDGVAYINLEYALTNTAYHEGTHPIIEMMMDSDPTVVDKMFKQIKSLSKNSSVKDVLNWAKSLGLSQDIAKKEAIIEFIARVADGQIDLTSLDKGTFIKVKEIINEFLDLLNI